jgi:hypothetical protein
VTHFDAVKGNLSFQPNKEPFVKLRNYTSGSPVDRSISFIERRLVEAGATQIAKSYGKGGSLVGVTFSMPGFNGKPAIVQLPANVDQCERAFLAEVKRHRKGTAEKIRLQAERTAWKLLADWVDVQVSMIALQQAEPLEIFLPYLYDSKLDQTLYRALKTGNEFKALPFGG